MTRFSESRGSPPFWRRRYRCRRAARSDRSGMLPQFIDEDPRVLAVVYGDRDQLHAALLKSLLERRHQPLGGLDPGPSRVMSARERDEIRVSERHAEIGKAVGRLLPADHAVGVVLQDQHHKIKPQALVFADGAARP